MKNKKKTGSFYSPEKLAVFLVDRISIKLRSIPIVSVLEPSAGDGIFVKTIYKHPELNKKIDRFVAIEIDNTELEKISNEIKYQSFKAFHADFLEAQATLQSKFSLIIGNPPYIKKNFLTENQISQCKSIHQCAGLNNSFPKNIWTSFLVRCIELTSENGILAFVLPSELLQVKFAAELRDLIINEFERVEIFTFNELLFHDCKGQDTLLLIGERKSEEKGVFFCNIDKLDDLSKANFELAKNIKIKESKWTHHHLESTEIELLEKIKSRLKCIDEYCSSKAGIVTAANKYFIVDEKTVKDYSLQKFIKPIIQKGQFVNGSADFNENDFSLLIEKSKPTNLIAISKNTRIRKNARIRKYLEIGENEGINNGYKTSQRENWYEIPNVGSTPEAFFFKRCHEYPKLILNSANVFATDSAYIIKMRDNYSIESLIYSFYNSLSLSFAELFGRYYGGGVLELTPNEFKILPVPYKEITMGDFKTFDMEFRHKSSIKEICEYHDKEILKSIGLDLDDDSIAKLAIIREKLYLRRIKSN